MESNTTPSPLNNVKDIGMISFAIRAGLCNNKRKQENMIYEE